MRDDLNEGLQAVSNPQLQKRFLAETQSGNSTDETPQVSQSYGCETAPPQ